MKHNKTVSVGGGPALPIGSFDISGNYSEKHPEQVDFAGGKSCSSKGPALHLIPTVAMEILAKRFQLGIERKGEKAWNALSSNQEVLTDREFLIERCSHVIHHAMKLRDQLAHGPNPELDKDSMEDNAGAVSWGGVFLSCAVDALEKEVVEPGYKSGVEITADLNLPPAEPTRVVQLGFTYRCINGAMVGPISKTIDNKYFCKTIHDVVWTRTGIPIKVNQDLTDEKVRGYRLLLEC